MKFSPMLLPGPSVVDRRGNEPAAVDVCDHFQPRCVALCRSRAVGVCRLQDQRLFETYLNPPACHLHVQGRLHRYQCILHGCSPRANPSCDTITARPVQSCCRSLRWAAAAQVPLLLLPQGADAYTTSTSTSYYCECQTFIFSDALLLVDDRTLASAVLSAVAAVILMPCPGRVVLDIFPNTSGVPVRWWCAVSAPDPLPFVTALACRNLIRLRC